MKATFIKQEIIKEPSSTITFEVMDEELERKVIEWFKNTGGTMRGDETFEFIPPRIRVIVPYKINNKLSE